MAKRTDFQENLEETTNYTSDDDALVAEVASANTDVTLETAAKAQNHSLLIKDQNRKKLVSVYSTEDKVSVMIAPMYACYFGKIMHVKINGISIAVPCNGKPYDVPTTFASEVFRRLRAINEQQQRQKRYADVSSNVESAPGELALF